MTKLLLLPFLVLCCWTTLTLEESVADKCFCKLQGEVDDCSCKVESVDSFNNLKVFPRLNSLLQKSYFKFWKVNLLKECPFWADDSRCALKDCQVNSCNNDELPDGLKNNNSKPKNKYSQEANEGSEGCEKDNELGQLDATISDASRQAFETWKKHDDAQHNFCELDDDNSVEAEYVDLLLNPERYTGYKGSSPHRIWNSIYNENCFKPDKKGETEYSKMLTVHSNGGSIIEDMCLEKRVFHRMVSGLHTSINIHLSADYYFPPQVGFGQGKWGPNLAEFQRRFLPDTTGDQGPQWLKNLYFAYLVEMRALIKAAPYLEQELFYTGDSKEDNEVGTAVREILNVLKAFPDQFDETKLFTGDTADATKLKEDFKQHFYNISRIMDCVGCDKCKLWGKLQVTGMGTALKILFSGNEMVTDASLSQRHKHMERPFHFQLNRQEIVSLFNAFGRLSTSIQQIEHFRSLMGS